jgi:hypothetical protein
VAQPARLRTHPDTGPSARACTGERPTAAHFDGVDFNRELLLYPASSTDEADAREAAPSWAGFSGGRAYVDDSRTRIWRASR